MEFAYVGAMRLETRPGAIVWLLLGLACGVLSLGAGTDTLRRVEFREPHASAYLIASASGTNAADQVRLASAAGAVWTTAQLEGTTNTVELSSRVALQLAPDQALNGFLAGRQLALSRTVASNLFILQAADSQAAIDAAETLARQEGVLASYPVMRRPLRRRDAYAKAPNDPRFSEQWHLENRAGGRSLAGPDLNVRAAWPVTRGEGVLVAVADDGFQLDHPELVNRAAGVPHYNFYRGTTNGSPASSDANHSTAVAGLIAAEQGNSRGISGVAPQARLASWVIFGTSHGQDSIATDEELMDMFQYAPGQAAVQNHSWGSATTTQLALDSLTDAGIANAVAQGRNGRGVVMVRAAGNAREDLTNVNDDGFANDPRAIAVAAVRKDGRACSYSTPGACLLVGAPSGDVLDTNNDGSPDAVDPDAPNVWTTDRTGSDGYNASSGDAGDYTGFNGTSASSPQVAGLVALVLAANPALTYRDVQQILIHCARHYDLADPDLRANGAGFRVSHNVGFGVPDAGFAVQLAEHWSNRPAATQVSASSTTRVGIPDDALRVVCSGSGISNSLASVRCLPSLGLHPDEPTPAMPIVYVGQANSEITQDLHGKAALIQRGVSYFSDKIDRAARAGAAFAVIFNNTGTTEVQAMGGTAFVPIPAVSIGKTDGESLRDFVASHPETTAKLQLSPAVCRFTLTNALVCEHVSVRLKTTHTYRGDVRVTLVSPMGTRSVLQAINSDSSKGPSDWTYWSTQHFYESSAGEWRLEVSDERNTTVRTFPYGTAAATGSLTYAKLTVAGVAISDADRDGLDDNWERQLLGGLSSGPRDDPDGDGFNNAREQVMGTDPLSANNPFKLDFAELAPGCWRFSWPGREGRSYTLQWGTDLGLPLRDLATVPGRLPVTEFVGAAPTHNSRFYRVRADGDQ